MTQYLLVEDEVRQVLDREDVLLDLEVRLSCGDIEHHMISLVISWDAADPDPMLALR